MDAVWVRNYQEGVPSAIDPDQYSSLNELFDASLDKYRHLPAYTNMGQTLTYDELDKNSQVFASYLNHELGVKKGDRFAIMLPNVLQYPVAILGVLRAGGVIVNINPLYTADEVENILIDAEPVGILVFENFAHTVAEALKKVQLEHIIIAKISDVFPKPKAYLVDFIVRYVKRMVPSYKIKDHIKYRSIIADGGTSEFIKHSLEKSDLAFLQYTGGTTGKAKGAMLSHRNIIASILQSAAWVGQDLKPKNEIVITPLPLYHIFSLTANCLLMMYLGAHNILITNPRDTKSFINDLKKYKFTAITGVNTLYNLLLNQPEIKEVDFSAVKIALGGGMAVQKSVAEKWQILTGKPLLEAYGLTEASPGVCINPISLKQYNGSVGLPISSTEISVRDSNNSELQINEIGELWVRGPQVMQGYWKNPAETAKVLNNDGWLRTGDVVRVDANGFVFVVDRLKDMIIVSGFNVYPNEVEDVIATNPGVLEVAVVGVPDQNCGEIVKAFIVRSDIKMTSEDIRHYCQQHLTAYKVPKQIEFRDSLPKSNVGKILRRALR